MIEVVCSGGPSGGEIVEVSVKPGEVFDVDGHRYRRDGDDPELAVYTGPAPGAPKAPLPSRVAAARAAREAG